jgi:hypothetical protein
VVVLDEDRIVQAQPMAEAAAAADGVFLEAAEAGSGFPSVVEPGPHPPTACHFGHELGCAGRDAGEASDEVESGALKREQVAFVARERGDGGLGGDAVASAASSVNRMLELNVETRSGSAARPAITPPARATRLAVACFAGARQTALVMSPWVGPTAEVFIMCQFEKAAD